MLAGAVEDAAENTWLLYEGQAFTYGQAEDQIRGAATRLAGLGIGRGDLVMTIAENAPEYLFTWLATVSLGAIFVPANPRSSQAELSGLRAQVQPRMLVSNSEHKRLAADTPWLAVQELFEHGERSTSLTDARIGEDDPAVLIPTSGTTGRSKLVTQTHRAYVMAGEGFPWWMELSAEDRLMTSLPLFHINAPAYSVLGSVAARASLVLLPRFSAGSFLDSARRYGATEFNAIGAMLEILMRQPERPDDAENPLRLCYTGPSPTRERQLQIEQRFGLRIVCGYAMSESPYGMIWPRGTRPFGTLGSPRQHPTLGQVNEARVIGDDGPVIAGEVGELQLRNPAVMKGYWGMPAETRQVLLADGWLRTGDLVFDDGDGTYTFVGREKEVIRRRGENLAPTEVEEVLVAHPDVFEAAVIGVPSELSEEDVKAFVVLADRGRPDLASIRSWVSERLASFKVPRYLEAVDELPHTPTGRVMKRELSRERSDAEVDFEIESKSAR